MEGLVRTELMKMKSSGIRVQTTKRKLNFPYNPMAEEPSLNLWKSSTGYTKGTIPRTSATETEYKFSIRPRNAYTDNDYSPPRAIVIYGEWVEYTLTIRGDANIEVAWS